MAGQTTLIPILLAALAVGLPVTVYGTTQMGMMGPWMGMHQGYNPSDYNMGMMRQAGWSDHCPHHEEMGGYEPQTIDGFEGTSITGTIVAKDEYRGILTIEAGDIVITAKLPGMLVDEDNGYLVSGKWLIEKIGVGDQVTVTIYGMMILSLDWNNKSYTVPMMH